MGLDAGYSKAAGRRIAIWEAMNQQAAAQATADAAKAKFEVPSTPEKAAEPTPTTTPPNNTSQLSAEMLDKILSMVSDLSDRFTKQEIGVEFAIDYLQEGKKANESLTKNVTDLTSKLEKIADDLSTLSTRLDEVLSIEPPEEAEEEPVAAPAAQKAAASSTNTGTAPTVQNTTATALATTASPTVQSEQTIALDPRLAALAA